MKNWKLELTSSGVSLGEVNVSKGIFQGDSLSPLLFVICVIPFTMVLRKANVTMSWVNEVRSLVVHGSFTVICHSQIDSIVRTLQMYCKDVRMELGMNKCGKVMQM